MTKSVRNALWKGEMKMIKRRLSSIALPGLIIVLVLSLVMAALPLQTPAEAQ